MTEPRPGPVAPASRAVERDHSPARRRLDADLDRAERDVCAACGGAGFVKGEPCYVCTPPVPAAPTRDASQTVPPARPKKKKVHFRREDQARYDGGAAGSPIVTRARADARGFLAATDECSGLSISQRSDWIDSSAYVAGRALLAQSNADPKNRKEAHEQDSPGWTAAEDSEYNQSYQCRVLCHT